MIQGDDTTAWESGEITLAQEGLTAINTMLADATQIMDSYLGNQYDLPLPAETIALNPLKRYCCDIARYLLAERLFKDSDEITLRYQDAMKWLQAVAEEKATLLLASADGSAAGQFIDIRGDDKRSFTDMAGF